MADLCVPGAGLCPLLLLVPAIVGRSKTFWFDAAKIFRGFWQA
jgi:hypothetical protein